MCIKLFMPLNDTVNDSSRVVTVMINPGKSANIKFV